MDVLKQIIICMDFKGHRRIVFVQRKLSLLPLKYLHSYPNLPICRYIHSPSLHQNTRLLRSTGLWLIHQAMRSISSPKFLFDNHALSSDSHMLFLTEFHLASTKTFHLLALLFEDTRVHLYKISSWISTTRQVTKT